MAAIGGAVPVAGARQRFADSLAFDTAFALLSFTFLGGLFVDGWAHNHINQIDTFFTPWHAMFYGGGLITALFAFGSVVASMPAQPRVAPLSLSWWVHWYAAVPVPYRWSVWGFAIFGISGIGDMAWHIVLGIEKNIDALLSPTHLGLATGMVLVLAGPLRAAVARVAAGTRPEGWGALLPAILSLTAVFSMLTFMSQYSTALAAWGTGSAPSQQLMDVRESRAVLSQLWSTALFVGPLLFAARAFGAALPFGWVTLVLGANAALMATQIDAYTMIPGVVAAGLCADLLYQGLKPSAGREAAFRVFAFATPALYWIFHDITLAATRQHFYVSVHLWTGLVVIAGLVGLLASFLAPPQMSSYE